MQKAKNREVCVRDLVTAFYAAIIVLLAVSTYGESAATSAAHLLPATLRNSSIQPAAFIHSMA